MARFWVRRTFGLSKWSFSRFMFLYTMLCRKKSIRYSLVFHLLPPKRAKSCTVEVLVGFLSGSPVAMFAVMEFLRVRISCALPLHYFVTKK